MDNLSIVIPFRNGYATIQRLIDSIPPGIPIIVVDDQSTVPLGEHDLPRATVARHLHRGYFTGAVNTGINLCGTDVLILNQDSYFENTAWLDLLAKNRERYGLIGEGIAGVHPAWPNGYIHGTFMFIRRDVIGKIHLLNSELYPLWGSTCEYQLRACRAGFEALPLPSVPGFAHRPEKKQRFGDSITAALQDEPGKRDLFIRTPPEVSVIIPCYNYGRYLKDTIDSLLAQTFQSFEVIIVDDASTDKSYKMALALASPWQGVRVIRHAKNAGTAAALNTGIKHAYGKYIAILSADDMMRPYRLDDFYRLQQKHPHSFIYDDLVVFGRDTSIGGTVKKGEDTIFPLPPYDFDKLIQKNGIHAGIFYPKTAWEEAGGYPEIMGRGREDWAFNVALGVKGWCGVKSDRPGYMYRRDGQNRTLTNTNHIARQNFMETMLQLFPNIYKGERPEMCCGGSKQTFKNGGSKVAKTAQAPGLPGAAAGFEILEYIGTNTADVTWTGPVTQHQYYLGGNRKLGYVDRRDVAAMVKFSDRGHPVFRVYVPPKPAKPAAPAPAVEIATPTEAVVVHKAQEPVAVVQVAPVVEMIVPEAAPVEVVKETKLAVKATGKRAQRRGGK